MSNGHLFNEYDIFSVLQSQTESVKRQVQSIPANTVLNASETDLIHALTDDFRLNVPVIKDDDIHIAETGETQVDVSGDPMRRGPCNRRPPGATL